MDEQIVNPKSILGVDYTTPCKVYPILFNLLSVTSVVFLDIRGHSALLESVGSLTL